MPVSIKKVKDKYRIVEPNGRIAKNKSGTALDGGGHSTKQAAVIQMRAINTNK